MMAKLKVPFDKKIFVGKSDLKSNAFGVVSTLFLFVYYSFFVLIENKYHGFFLQSYPNFRWILFLFLFFSLLPPLYVKGLMLRKSKASTRQVILKFIMLHIVLLSYIIFFIACMSHFRPFSSIYVKYHSSIHYVVSMIMGFMICTSLKKVNVFVHFMEQFKTFPIISPLICFTASSNWRENLMKMGIDNHNYIIINATVIISGVIFFISILLYYIAKAYDCQWEKEAYTTENIRAKLIDSHGGFVTPSCQRPKLLFIICNILICTGLTLLLGAIFELSFYFVKG